MLRVLAAAAALVLGALPGAALQAQSTDPHVRLADDPYARHGWHLELGLFGALEAWNYNGSHEELSAVVTGLGYGLGRGIALVGRGLISCVGQRGPDALLMGATIGARGPIHRRPSWSLFWEVDVGISQADSHVPPRGTRFNYLAVGGVGTTIRLREALHLQSGLRWIHISNGGHAGRDRNPDIEAIGAQMGVLVAF